MVMNLKRDHHCKVKQSSALTTKNKAAFFQPKNTSFQDNLSINPSNDAYEKEADAVAGMVINQSANDCSFFKPGLSTVQRKCADVQREEALTNDTQTENYLKSVQSGGEPLNRKEKDFFEKCMDGIF